jgi:hypothetical protein
MTTLRLEIRDLVLSGLPPSYGEGFGALVQERLTVLAHGGILVEGDGEHGLLADRVAREVWSQVQLQVRSAGGGAL